VKWFVQENPRTFKLKNLEEAQTFLTFTRLKKSLLVETANDQEHVVIIASTTYNHLLHVLSKILT
jgi:hypothetical protein